MVPPHDLTFTQSCWCFLLPHMWHTWLWESGHTKQVNGQVRCGVTMQSYTEVRKERPSYLAFLSLSASLFNIPSLLLSCQELGAIIPLCVAQNHQVDSGCSEMSRPARRPGNSLLDDTSSAVLLFWLGGHYTGAWTVWLLILQRVNLSFFKAASKSSFTWILRHEATTSVFLEPPNWQIWELLILCDHVKYVFIVNL